MTVHRLRLVNEMASHRGKMFRTIVGAVALCASVLWAQVASAEALRFPETGLPAVQVTVPDGWQHSVKDGTLHIDHPLIAMGYLITDSSDSPAEHVLFIAILSKFDPENMSEAQAGALANARLALQSIRILTQ
jgi:hypothetical protein